MEFSGAKQKPYIRSLWLALAVILAGCGLFSQKSTPGSANQNTGGVITGSVALPRPEIPQPLAIRAGSVSVQMTAQAQAVGDQVQLRFLLIGLNAGDFGLDTWKAVLDRVGAPYDVFLAQDSPLEPSNLVDADGSGKYSAILLTNSSLLYQDGTGAYVSALSAVASNGQNGWNNLWTYERSYRVRQVSLYTAPGTFPEDYCLRAVSEGGVGGTPLNASFTTAGARIFTDLKPSAQVPILLSYIYSTSIAAGCNATAILTVGTSVLGVTSTSTDGRERAALTFSSNVNLLQSTLLTYGLIRWASKGVFLGERKHYLNVDVDDWFNTGDERNPDGTFVPGGYRMTAQDVLSSEKIQADFIKKYNSLLDKFQLNIAYNGGDADLTQTKCERKTTKNDTGDPLTAATLCVDNKFNWINHTLSHMKLNDPNIATLSAINTEIAQNFAVAQSLKIKVTDTTVLKTGEYSGLGVYNPDPNNDIDPPTDYGLMGSNPNLLQAAKNNGIKYLHGNMSFKSHQPSCFNCGIYHPMDTSLLVVPDWPTNIAYLATTPAEEEGIYNCFFGPNGTCAGGTLRYWPQDLTYSQIIEVETDLAFQQHLAAGSVYSHTLHVGNLREYNPGKNMVFDWLDRLVAKYAAYYKVKLLNPNWTGLASYVADRTSHFSTLAGGAKAVWDRATNRITVTSPVAGTLYLTGIEASGYQRYGSDSISRLPLAAGQSLSYVPAGYVSTLSDSVDEQPGSVQ